MNSAAKTALHPNFRCRLFEGLDNAVVREVVDAARPVRLRARQVFDQCWEIPDRMYVLTSGQGQVSWDSEDGKRTILHGFGPGGIFGGVAMMRKPISLMATVEIVEDGEALTWTHDVIRALAYRYPALFDNFLTFVAELLQILLAAHISLGTEEAEGRMARALLELGRQVGRKGERGSIELQITNDKLADMVHISPYTASRIVSDWTRRGFIRRMRGRIVILSEQRLMRGR